MNKKQAGIIVTLLALIVCAGILATKVNGPLDPSVGFDNGSGVFSMNKENNTSTTTDYFTTAKIDREQKDSMVLAQYKTMIDDKNVSQASRTEAEKKYLTKTTSQDYEHKIELNLKGKGFDDAICFIEENKARVIVKGKEISEQQRKQIKDVVMSVSKISTVEIELKQ
jgi:stage III sporulation protein AH